MDNWRKEKKKLAFCDIRTQETNKIFIGKKVKKETFSKPSVVPNTKTHFFFIGTHAASARV